MGDLQRLPAFWGRFSIPKHSSRQWKIGPLLLRIEHQPHEWRISQVRSDDPHDASIEVGVGVGANDTPLADSALLHRFALQETRDQVELLPALADRPVIIRPDTPFHLLSGEEVTLYVSTPVWVRVSVTDPARLLLDVPTFRPSDTWLGPNTREGELCYAGRTAARMRLQDVPSLPSRALTAFVLRNRAKDALLVDRLNLPVPLLSVYADERNQLWTQGVALEREEEGLLGAIKLDAEAPPEAKGAVQLVPARRHPERHLLLRAIGALLG